MAKRRKRKKKAQKDPEGFVVLEKRDRYENNPSYVMMKNLIMSGAKSPVNWNPAFVAVHRCKQLLEADKIDEAEYRDLANMANMLL